MIVKKVKSLFMGKVAVHQKYIKKAVEKEEDLLVKYKESSMIIPWQKIDKKGKMGKEVYLDKFENEYYNLIYFEWKPGKIQEKLI